MEAISSNGSLTMREDTNNTTMESWHPSGQVAVAQSVLFALTLIISCFANGLLLFLLFRCKELRTMSNILVADLAITDVLNLVINVPLFVCYAVLNLEAFRGKRAAWWVSMLHISLSFLTLTTMFLMMIDRFLAIRFPLEYKCIKSKTKVYLAIFIKWAATVITVLCVYVPLRKIDLGKRPVIEYRVAYNKANNVITRILAPVVLLGIVILFLISRRTVRSSIQDQLNASLPRAQFIASRKRKQKAINTILINVIIFCISYLPVILSGVHAQGLSDSPGQWLVYTLGFLLYFPAMSNPFVYFMRISGFRSALKELFLSGGHRIRPRVTLRGLRIDPLKLKEGIVDHTAVNSATRVEGRELVFADRLRRWSDVWRAQAKLDGNQQAVNSSARRHSI